MAFLYQIGIQLAAFFIPISSWFSSKMKLFVDGRKQSFQILKEKIHPSEKYIWVHVASLGEYEQGLPIMEAFKKEHPEYKIVLTFFSPSGYEIRKNNKIADVTLYLPLDTKTNAKRFVDLVQPKMVFFIKYEFWLNYLKELKQQNIPTYLVSGIFRENQLFFKGYGGFYRDALQTFDHFFVQNEKSKQLLNSIDFNNVTVHGDTRFDRVARIVERVQPLDFIEKFKKNTTTIVIGSSWVDDENVYLPYLNASKNIKFIIAPHNIKEEEITRLISKIGKKVIRYTNYKEEDLKTADVFIIDTIGILTQIYAYADIAYVGGAFKTGLHNILEPATYGTPVVIGPKYEKFQEAKDLVALGSCLVVHNTEELTTTFNQLIQDKTYRSELGTKNRDFVLQNKNATNVVMDFIESKYNL
ncbi:MULTISPECIES: 3-deoxy-D-manno-octulosonic acid transferase [unclassified Flavobacterium]|uniref:3-deoxy-D-manno-octulosonic acid transferase n=1 Tax=unclassified Flavobacterium TaxID=196869 RepID=UPI0013D4F468|nr:MULTISPECIES: glycosyltransferase N-terminal domain-containing protein [unclassified Flavobacterium]MBA5792438.1 3-deoxy-D-manno-octulosonic acid transferase [Flavobacterium sp. xlx-221]